MTTPPKSETNFIGIELCGGKLRAATVDKDGVISQRVEEPLEAANLIAQLARVVKELQQTANNIGAVGIAIPGLVNRHTDRVIASNYLPGPIRENLHEEAMKATGLRVELENDECSGIWRVQDRRRPRQPRPLLHNDWGRHRRSYHSRWKTLDRCLWLSR